MAENGPALVQLHDRLDALWTSYLSHLDAYTEHQKLLQKHMSSGFLSLAKANFNARDGVRRYGKDYYHHRAVATKRVNITESEAENEKPGVNILRWTPPKHDEGEESDAAVEVEKVGEKDEEVTQQPSPPSTPDNSTSQEARNLNDKQSSVRNPAKTPLESDPLRWFGILVPPALRSAQTSFSSAVDNAIAEAVNAARAMRECEVEIRKLRKEIRKAEREAKSD